jgi:hypothetical protein
MTKLNKNILIDNTGVSLDDISKLQPYSIFSGNTTGIVTCSNVITNYRYISIIYSGADGGYNSTGLIPVSNNRLISLMTHSFRDNQATLCLWVSTLKISGNQLIPQTNKWIWRNVNNIGFSDGNYVNVLMVVAYK